MRPTRVILDCDTANEIDDQFAIAHALGVPGETLEVRGVVEILELWSKEYEAPETRKELWDLACVAAVADPEFVTAGPQALPTLDAAGAHDFTQPGRVANVVSDLDGRRILAGFMEALKNHPTG
jgi:inosine-uridine nucleoside N-ribohydrolase